MGISDRRALFAMKKVVKAKILCGEYDLAEKTFTDTAEHAVWDVFRQVRDTRDNFKNIEFVACVQCVQVQAYKEGNGTSALRRHIDVCVQNPANLKLNLADESRRVIPPAWAVTECKRAQAEFCAVDMRPPHAFKGRGLLNLVQVAIDVGAKCGRVDAKALLSSPTTVSTEIKGLATKAREAIAPELRLAMQERRAAATIDGYTHKNTKIHYLTMTAHYITPKWTLLCRTLFTIDMPADEPCSADNVRAALKRNLASMGVPADLVDNMVFVTDGGLDMVNAVQPFSTRLYCMGHGLNIVVRTTFSVKYASITQAALRSCPEAEELIANCNTWVQDVRKALPSKHLARKQLKCTQSASESHLPPLLSYCHCRQQVTNNTIYVYFYVSRTRFCSYKLYTQEFVHENLYA